MSTYFETFYLTFFNDNIYSNSIFLHANHIIYIQKPLILYNIYICIKITSVFSNEYNTLFVTYILIFPGILGCKIRQIFVIPSILEKYVIYC